MTQLTVAFIYLIFGLLTSSNSFALTVEPEKVDPKEVKSIAEKKSDEKITEKNPRTPQFENELVEVWNTKILPNQPLKMHRHDKKRILVGISDIELKVVNEKNDVHYIKLKKSEAKLMEADIPGELHGDVNESKHPMEVVVIQFK